MIKTLLFFLLSSIAVQADTKISQLPLQSAASVNTNDSFPFVNSNIGETMRLKLSDLPSTPGFISAFSGLQTTLPLTTKGDILTRNNSSLVRFPVCANGQIMVADSSQSVGWKCAGSSPATMNSVSVSYTIGTLAGNYALNVNGSGPLIITLPDASIASGFFVDIKDLTTNLVTINTTLGQTIDGQSTQTISDQWDSLHLGANNGNWFIY